MADPLPLLLCNNANVYIDPIQILALVAILLIFGLIHPPSSSTVCLLYTLSCSLTKTIPTVFSLGANTSSSPHVLKQSIGFYQWVDHTRLVTEVKTRISFSRLGKGCYLTSSVTPLIQFNSPGLALWIKCRRSGCTPDRKHTRLFVYCSCRHHRCHPWNSFRLAEIQMFRWSWNIRQILNTESGFYCPSLASHCQHSVLPTR